MDWGRYLTVGSLDPQGDITKTLEAPNVKVLRANPKTAKTN